jgi:hypothetical protein
MEFKEFEKLIKTYQKTLSDFRELSQMGFDFAEGKFKLELHCDNMLQIILDSTYTDEGVDWIFWFMFENDFGEKDLDASENGEKICYDLPSLWEYIKQYKKH